MNIIVNNNLVDIKSKVPSRWKCNTNDTIFIRGYSTFGINRNDLNSQIKELDFEEVKVIIFYGEFEYFEQKLSTLDASKGKGNIIEPKTIYADKDVYVFIMTPSCNFEAVDMISGFLNAFLDKNITCEFMFDAKMFASGEGTVAEYSCINYSKRSNPDMSYSKLNLITRAYRGISKKTEKDKNKILYSLNWFFSAIRDGENFNRLIDIFVKYWIAIEAISMHDTTRHDLKDELAKIYSMKFEIAAKMFQIEEIYDIRCSIVHDGKLIEVDDKLLEYMESLYIDILYHKLGVHSQFRAKKHIDHGLNIKKYLR